MGGVDVYGSLCVANALHLVKSNRFLSADNKSSEYCIVGMLYESRILAIHLYSIPYGSSVSLDTDIVGRYRLDIFPRYGGNQREEDGRRFPLLQALRLSWAINRASRGSSVAAQGTTLETRELSQFPGPAVFGGGSVTPRTQRAWERWQSGQ